VSAPPSTLSDIHTTGRKDTSVRTHTAHRHSPHQNANMTTQSDQQQRLSFILVTRGNEPSVDPGSRPNGVRYTRDGIRVLLQHMGCKQRRAQKVTQLMLQSVAQRIPELRRPGFRRGDQWGLHQLGEHTYVSVPRSDFNDLMCRCLCEHNYKYLPSADELKVACRWVLPSRDPRQPCSHDAETLYHANRLSYERCMQSQL
jgi:hypothetical protein